MKSRQEYLKSLPKKRCGSALLLFDKLGKILIVKPNYRNGWILPGGTVNKNESPQHACIREVKEELGIILKKVKFVCADFKIEDDESLQFTFDGGILTKEKIKKIKLQEKELLEYQFIAPKNLGKFFIPSLAKRIPKCLKAMKDGRCLYLENGEYV